MPVSIAVVGGAGLIGRRHVEHCLAEDDVELCCIVDPTTSGVAFAREVNVPLFETLDELISAKTAGQVNLDGVVLATPNHTHVPLAIQSLAAGIPTLVEKPLSTDIASGMKLVESERSSRARILVGHHRRFNPYVCAMKDLLASGSIGDIVAVQGQWTALKPLSYFQHPTEWRQDSSTGGVILINLVHDIDLLRHLIGNVARVYCEVGKKTRGFQVEETGAVTLRFASGVVGTFVFSDATASAGNFEAATGENPLIPQSSNGPPVYTVFGTEGSFSFPDLKLHRYASRSGSWTDRLDVDASPSIDSTLPFTRQLRHFARLIRGEEEPNCSAQDALLTIHTLEAIARSARTGLPVMVTEQL